MAVNFLIPGPLREFAGNRSDVQTGGDARSVNDALTMLWRECPGLRDRVVTELGEVRPHVNIFVDGDSIKYIGGLEAPVRDGAEIVILPALSGG